MCPASAALANVVDDFQTERRDAVQMFGRREHPHATYPQVLQDLGVRRMRVLSAPKHLFGISAFGLEIVDYVGESG